MTVDVKLFLPAFLEESREGLDVVEAGLLRLDSGAAPGETIHDIFRAIHSIKGGCGTFGLVHLIGLGHVMESLLDEMRDGKRPVTREAVQLLLAGADRLRLLLRESGEGSGTTEAGEIQRQLERLVATAPSAAATVETPAAAATVVAEPARSGWSISFQPAPHLFGTGNDPLFIFRELAALGELRVVPDLSALPSSFGAFDFERCYLGWKLELRGAAQRAEVAEAFAWVEGDCVLEIAPLSAPSPTVERPSAPPPAVVPPAATEAASGATAAVAHSTETSSIRVGIDKVDDLVNMVGELVITQSMLSQLSKSIEGPAREQLRRGLAQLERNTRELQESAMRIRMLPIKFAFSRLHRLVHDLSATLGKRVALKLSGEQTELDKTVLEKIGDPLVHLVRNSLDHGIETPDVRRAAGKAEEGTLHLSAFHRGGNIVIQIEDDGAGLNLERIEARGRDKGLIAPGARPTQEELQQLIFNPGFSTAESVSQISGRGVGMDVVARNIKSLGGQVQLTSVRGQGTTFTIRLPLTMAILDAQMVRVGDDTYIFPLVSIVESMQMRATDISEIAGRVEIYRVRGEAVPVLRLGRLLQTNGRAADDGALDGKLLVLVEAEGKRVGLVVDDLLEQQQVVIKSLESNFRRVPGVSGATILGDGSVALILDVSGLIQLGQSAAPPVRAAVEAAQSP